MNSSLPQKAEAFSAELRFLIAMLRAESRGDGLSRIPEGIDWGRFVDLCDWHRLAPIASAILDRNRATQPPDEARAILDQRRRRNALRTLRQEALLGRIMDALSSAGARALTVKGLALRRIAYRGSVERFAGDIDVLIEPSDLAAARAALATIGCLPALEDGPTFDDPGLTPRQSAFVKRHASHQRFRLEGSGAMVEVHWRLGWNGSLWNEEFEDLWSRRRSVEAAGREVFTLSEGDTWAHLETHGAKHAWFRLFWLCDLNQIRRANGQTPFDTDAHIGPALCSGRVHQSTRELERFVFEEDEEVLIENGPAALRTSGARYAARLWDRRINPENLGFRAGLRHWAYRVGLTESLAGAMEELEQVAIAHGDFKRARFPDPLFPLYALARPVSWVSRRLLVGRSREGR